MSLQLSLPVSLQDNILCYPYKGIAKVVSLLSSLLTSLWSGFIQSSLLASQRRESLLSTLLVSLWNISPGHLYKNISSVKYMPSQPEMFLRIPSKPEILLQLILEFIIYLCKQNLKHLRSGFYYIDYYNHL